MKISMFHFRSVHPSPSHPADERDEGPGEQKENNNRKRHHFEHHDHNLRGEFWHEDLSRMVLFRGRINEEFGSIDARFAEKRSSSTNMNND